MKYFEEHKRICKMLIETHKARHVVTLAELGTFLPLWIGLDEPSHRAVAEYTAVSCMCRPDSAISGVIERKTR